MMKRNTLVFGWAVCLAITLAACGGEKAAPPADTAAPGEDTAAAPPAVAKKYRIAVVPKGLVHQFWLTVKAGAEAAGKEFGAEIIWNGPDRETEIAKQMSIIEDMVSSGVDAIVMAACDENALIDTVQNAMNRGVPVVTIDSGIKSDIPVSFIATDNVAGAEMAADELVSQIGEEGQVGLLPFVKGAATSEQREEGFKRGLEKYPDLMLVSTLYSDSDVAKAMSITEDMMTSHPRIKGIFAANEASAIGAVQALEAMNMAGHVSLIAFDASKEEIAALERGTITALIVQNPFQMGYLGVKAAIDHIEGRPVEKRIDTGVVVVRADNMHEPEIHKLLYPLEAAQ